MGTEGVGGLYKENPKKILQTHTQNVEASGNETNERNQGAWGVEPNDVCFMFNFSLNMLEESKRTLNKVFFF